MNNVNKSIYKKNRRRSRYDKLSSDIVASALSLWKKDFDNGKIEIKAKNKSNNQIETIQLVPFGKTILRQVSF